MSESRKEKKRRIMCATKRRYSTWEEARAAGVAVWLESPRSSERDANPPLPYFCDQPGEPHYHIGHLRFGGSRTTARRPS